MITLEEAILGRENGTKYRVVDTCSVISARGKIVSIGVLNTGTNVVQAIDEDDGESWGINLNNLEPVNNMVPDEDDGMITITVPKEVFSLDSSMLAACVTRAAIAQIANPQIAQLISKGGNDLAIYERMSEIRDETYALVRSGFKK